jgi:prepilin-type N-terminal cleavage/methylation domain-containing protein
MNDENMNTSVLRPSSFRSRLHAFTLIEVLCVVAVIGILLALLLPVLSSARRRAHRTACVAQLHQIGLGVAQYQQDWNELPLHLSMSHPSAVNDARLFLCPSDAKAGQFAGNDYLEGNSRLSSGVSYEYFPQWDLQRLAGLNWYEAPPAFGHGKWEDLTPLVGCAWHWAKAFNAGAPSSDSRSSGWELILTLGGSVRKIRAEQPMSQFTPEKYN